MKTREVLVFTRRSRRWGRWEFAHKEWNEHDNCDWWVRRDFSHICRVGDEIATLPTPKAPARHAVEA